MRVVAGILSLSLAGVASFAANGRAGPDAEVVPLLRATVAHGAAPAEVTPAPAPSPLTWADELPALRFFDVNSRRAVKARLYAGDGTVDPAAAVALDRLLAPAAPPQKPGAPQHQAALAFQSDDEGDERPPMLDRRLLQLVVKAAAHFDAREVHVISSWRPSRSVGCRHRTGEAMDFQLPGTAAATLAAWLRGTPRAGVGIYTHPRTQFVHLDVRDQSFHWIDGSPPGRSWREASITSRTAAAVDAAYAPEQDLPERAFPSISNR